MYIGYSRLELHARQTNDDEIFYIGSVLLRSIRPRRIVDTAYNFSVMTLVSVVFCYDIGKCYFFVDLGISSNNLNSCRLLFTCLKTT